MIENQGYKFASYVTDSYKTPQNVTKIKENQAKQGMSAMELEYETANLFTAFSLSREPEVEENLTMGKGCSFVPMR